MQATLPVTAPVVQEPGKRLQPGAARAGTIKLHFTIRTLIGTLNDAAASFNVRIEFAKMGRIRVELRRARHSTMRPHHLMSEWETRKPALEAFNSEPFRVTGTNF